MEILMKCLSWFGTICLLFVVFKMIKLGLPVIKNELRNLKK